MPFTTLQDRRLIIERQPVPGSQFKRAKFNLGEVHLILPPVGKTEINCQGVDIPIEGKRLQVTKELVALIQAGFVRIANEIDNTGQENQSSAPVQKTDNGDSSTEPSPLAHVVDISSLDLQREATPPSVFSSVEEIRTCQDREKLRLYVKSKTTYDNEKTHIDALRASAEKLFIMGAPDQ
jgi:hypothetical protein